MDLKKGFYLVRDLEITMDSMTDLRMHLEIMTEIMKVIAMD